MKDSRETVGDWDIFKKLDQCLSGYCDHEGQSYGALWNWENHENEYMTVKVSLDEMSRYLSEEGVPERCPWWDEQMIYAAQWIPFSGRGVYSDDPFRKRLDRWKRSMEAKK